MSLDSAVQALLKRLEVVTARLENVEKQLASGATAGGSFSGAPGGAPAGGDDGEVSASVQDYDQLISEHIVPLGKSTQTIGNDELKAQVALVEKAINAQRQFLVVASKSKKPDDATLQKLLEATTKLMTEVGAIRDKAGKVNKMFNHLSTLSEGIGCLGWVVVTPTPAPFVNEARASSEFYSNKILMEFKGKDETQTGWVHNWNTFMKDLFTFIKKHHTTGLTWNPRGGDASAATAAAPAAPKGPPPPPAGGPPPPPPPAGGPPAGSSKAAPDTGALFAALSKGEAITSGLKKVDKSQMTHKNPELRATSVVKAEDSEKKAAPKKAAAAAAKKGTPKFELEAGKKWLVEWQDNNKSIDINETAKEQTVYIYKCENSVVKISGKVNSIVVDSCKKTAVVFQDAIASCELVNSNSIEVQITGKIPAVAIDKCSGVQLFVSKESLAVEIVSSKSDQMNVLIPDPAGGQDPIEIPVPEQYKTKIQGAKLVTTTYESV